MKKDLIIGFIVAAVVGLVLNVENKISVVVFGMIASISPDVDFLVYWIRKKKIDQFAHEHRDLLHYPLWFPTIGGLLFWYIFGWVFGIVWFLVTMGHFIHDTGEGGYGIRWLYPFNKKYFLLKSITKEEQRKLAEEYGNPDWFKQSIPKFMKKLL